MKLGAVRCNVGAAPIDFLLISTRMTSAGNGKTGNLVLCGKEQGSRLLLPCNSFRTSLRLPRPRPQALHATDLSNAGRVQSHAKLTQPKDWPTVFSCLQQYVVSCTMRTPQALCCPNSCHVARQACEFELSFKPLIPIRGVPPVLPADAQISWLAPVLCPEPLGHQRSSSGAKSSTSSARVFVQRHLHVA